MLKLPLWSRNISKYNSRKRESDAKGSNSDNYINLEGLTNKLTTITTIMIWCRWPTSELASISTCTLMKSNSWSQLEYHSHWAMWWWSQISRFNSWIWNACRQNYQSHKSWEDTSLAKRPILCSPPSSRYSNSIPQVKRTWKTWLKPGKRT